MFVSLTKSKFYSKCKSLIRMTKTRVEVLKKKKKAVAKYLKNDVADLLNTGLDYNAYGRAEVLLVELNVLACYEFIEQFCECILSNLTAMDKQKDCPDACKEAVQSLVYAAARFAEFPELRDLRSLFSQRYGSSLELFVNKEFIEKSKPQPPSEEVKVQLMHDVAKELSLHWSSDAIEQKLFQPQAEEAKEHSLPESRSLHEGDLADGLQDHGKRTDFNLSERDQSHIQNDHGYDLKNGNKYGHARRYSYDVGFGYNMRNKDKEPEFFAGKDSTNEKHNFASSSEDETMTSINTRGSSSPDSSLASSSSLGTSDNEEDAERRIPYKYLPPPYLNPKAEKQEAQKAEVLEKVTENVAAEAGETKPKPRSVRSRPAKPAFGHSNDVIERPLKPPPAYIKRPLNPSPPLEKDNSAETPSLLRRFSEGKKKDDHTWHRKGFQDRRDEEKLLDDLLMRYSKKGPPIEMETLKPQPQPQPHRPSDGKGEALLRSTKSVLPGAEPSEKQSTAGKSHARSLSMQPAVMAGHVHPKLPDYDDLAARLASLRGR